jgi:hypothetical protein
VRVSEWSRQRSALDACTHRECRVCYRPVWRRAQAPAQAGPFHASASAVSPTA